MAKSGLLMIDSGELITSEEEDMSAGVTGLQLPLNRLSNTGVSGIERLRNDDSRLGLRVICRIGVSGVDENVDSKDVEAGLQLPLLVANKSITSLDFNGWHERLSEIKPEDWSQRLVTE